MILVLWLIVLCTVVEATNEVVDVGNCSFMSVLDCKDADQTENYASALVEY